MAGILFITSNRLGDAVLSTGALAHVMEKWPGVPVVVACGPLPAPLFEGMPGIARVIRLKKGPWARHWRRLLRACAFTRWDVVVDLRNSLVSRLLVAKKRIIAKPSRTLRHKVVELAELVGASPPPAPRLWISEKDAAKAEELMRGQTPIFALGPAANWRGKTWRAERFAELAQKLVADGGARVAVFAARSERAQVAAVLAAIPQGQLLDLVDLDSLPLTAACLARCRLFIGNDSGLMHMASAVDCPTIGLFGPSHDEVYAPWGNACRVVRTPESFDDIVSRPGYNHLTTDTLMDGITVSDVYGAAMKLLDVKSC